MLSDYKPRMVPFSIAMFLMGMLVGRVVLPKEAPSKPAWDIEPPGDNYLSNVSTTTPYLPDYSASTGPYRSPAAHDTDLLSEWPSVTTGTVITGVGFNTVKASDVPYRELWTQGAVVYRADKASPSGYALWDMISQGNPGGDIWRIYYTGEVYRNDKKVLAATRLAEAIEHNAQTKDIQSATPDTQAQ